MRLFADGVHQRDDGRANLVRGLQGANDLDQLHHRDGIEEMHADHAARRFRRRRNLGDGNRRGIGRQNGVDAADAVEIGHHRLLDLEFLQHRFDHQIALAQRLQFGRRRDPRESRIGVGDFEFFARNQPVEAFPDRVDALIERFWRNVAQDDGKAGHGEGLGDAIAHRARADDTDPLDFDRHATPRSLQLRPSFTTGSAASQAFSATGPVS